MVKKKSEKDEIMKLLKKKIMAKEILKPNKVTMVIKKTEQEPYRPIYFKEFMHKETRNLFLE